ncbi:hypothetical protein QFC22_001723 [Naganishia vaughanmartiniae]|uniref:Uncharacterized protein n=1 Tax=Naganishia vaughanmartiniae TaxID=1424756 RepID=A0ACC2XEF7_9TREE|nr:hypothetical protein QFC22_001723 [Naganishia vaughanmartiniae]
MSLLQSVQLSKTNTIMARGISEEKEPPRELRRIGGPPRKLPSTTKATEVASSKRTTTAVSKSKAGKATSKQPLKHDFAVPAKEQVDSEPASSNLGNVEGEDEDEWDEVNVANESAGPSAPGTDYETDATGKSTGIKSDAPTGDEEDVDLEAVYGYDFHDEPDARPEQAPATNGQASDGTIEIRIGRDDGLTQEQRRRKEVLALRKKPVTARDRAIRLEVHKMHVVALLANAALRNKWCSDDLLKARLLSLTPHNLHAAFHIPPSRIPDVVQRSRLFMTALQDLATWWANDFFTVSDWSTGIRTKSWDEVMDIVDSLPRLVRPLSEKEGSMNAKGKGKERDDIDDQDQFVAALGAGGERIRTIKSLMKKALQGTGGRDISAQLFVSLCRALGLGTRLVVSLQPVQWKSDKQPTTKKGTSAAKASSAVHAKQIVAGVDANENGMETQRSSEQQSVRANTKPRRKGKMPEKTQSDEDEEDEFEEVSIPATSATSTPVKNSTKARWIDTHGKLATSRGQSLGVASTASEAESETSTRTPNGKSKKDVSVLYKLKKVKPKPQTLGSADSPKKQKKDADLFRQPPVFWAEVYSRPDQKWIPVDPVRGTIKRKRDFEPTSESGPIRMLYVVAFEEDGHARDVTVRYAKNFAAKTVKLRVPSRKGKEDWWERIMKMLQRPYRLHRDDVEDAELETSQISEGMPMVLQGFKDHPLYVLERHLKREEVIMPKKEVGKFRGEPVYRRANVQSCKTAENWMRMGRKVKPREEPLKWVKQRAVTLDRRRAQEMAIQEGHEPLQQGLYAEWQTEVYRPSPIKDGIIPTNTFGNIDLYTETMLPEGAVHLPYKGIAKVAKQLGIQYAEACTGFEFKKQRAIPIITGIVVAVDQEKTLMKAYKESAAAAEERALTKRQGLALKRWQKLIQGIQIRRRLQDQYGDKETAGPSLELVRAPAIVGIKSPKTPRAKEDKPGKVTQAAKSDVQVEIPKPSDLRPIVVDEPETPLTDIEDPIPIARPRPRIKLRMPSKTAKTEEAEDTGTIVVEEAVMEAYNEEPAVVPTGNLETAQATSSARPRRSIASRPPPQSSNKASVQRPIRGNKRISQKPTSPPPTRTLRSRRGDKTAEEAQKEKEKAEAIRAALESGDDDDEDEMDVDEGI